jgi:desulfoferrodoxin (superoxide reductase-like protein)
MQRRSFLTVLSVAGCGGLGWILEACSNGTQELKETPPPAPSSSASSSAASPPPKGPPTDGDEFVPGSGDGGVVVQPASGLPNANWEARVKQLESSGTLYTEAAPGKWVGKERSHVPTIVADTVEKNRVTVLVNHVMQKAVLLDAGAADANDAGGLLDGGAEADAAAPPPLGTPEHYVTTIYVKTDAGVVAGLVEFSSSDASPPSVTFVLPAGVKSVTAYENCNIHGLWASTALAVST